MLENGGLRERPLGAEKADFQGFLLGQAGRHDLAEQAQHFLVAHRSFVALEDLAQNLGLALRPVILDRGAQLTLGDAHLLCDPSAFVDQRLQALIDLVNAFADLLKIQLA